MRYVFE